MTTLAPQIGPAGISGPSYADVFAELQNFYWSIYGSDAVLDPSTQDGQFLAVIAQAIYDTGQACIAVYNAFSPQTAQGTGLSSIVAINGLTRGQPSFSTCTVTLTGTAGTAIANGIVGDDQNLNTEWALPASVTIGIGGTVTVTAMSATAGNVSAAAGTLTQILTPVAGWQSVTNASAAVVGMAAESDPALRQRQARSAALPALTTLESIWAAVAAVPDVQSVAIFENDTDTTNGPGLPAHSISAVVLGGTIADVAGAIALKKSEGTATYGTTSYTVMDSYGIPDTINFYWLAQIPITVDITITPLTGYVSTTAAMIAAAAAGYISSLAEGVNSYLNKLWGPANLSGDAAVAAINAALGTAYTQAQLDAFAATYNVTAITQSRSGPPSAADVTINFYEQAICAASTNVTVTA